MAESCLKYKFDVKPLICLLEPFMAERRRRQLKYIACALSSFKKSSNYDISSNKLHKNEVYAVISIEIPLIQDNVVRILLNRNNNTDAALIITQIKIERYFSWVWSRRRLDVVLVWLTHAHTQIHNHTASQRAIPTRTAFFLSTDAEENGRKIYTATPFAKWSNNNNIFLCT